MIPSSPAPQESSAPRSAEQIAFDEALERDAEALDEAARAEVMDEYIRQGLANPEQDDAW